MATTTMQVTEEEGRLLTHYRNGSGVGVEPEDMVAQDLYWRSSRQVRDAMYRSIYIHFKAEEKRQQRGCATR